MPGAPDPLEGDTMLPTHRQVATYRDHTIYQRQPGFEYTPIMLAKVASYLVLAPGDQITVFAFLYSLLAPLEGEAIEEERLLTEAVAVIRRRIETGLSSDRDLTYEYRDGRYLEVAQPRWWIPTRP